MLVMNLREINVVGPRMTLFAAGAELQHLYPVSIAAHGLELPEPGRLV